MSTFTKFLINCAVMMLCAVIAVSQVTTIISGVVLGKDGKPLEGAEVKIIRTDIKANYSIKTKKDGKYSYPTLPMGVFDVVVAVNGVDSYKTSNIKTDPGKPSVVDIDLSKAEAQQAAAAGAATANNEKEKAAAAERDKAAKAKYDQEKQAYDEAQSKQAGLQTAFTAGMQAATAKN